MTTDSFGTPAHPAPRTNADGGIEGVTRRPAEGGITSPLPPPQRPGASVPMDRGGPSSAPLTPNSSPLPANPDRYLEDDRRL